MIDRVFILVRSGKGGDGAISGRHEKYVPRGGPDGGNGGDGGSVYLLSDSNVNTLLEYRYKRQYTARPGGKGQGALKHGKNGKDITLTVPVGTQVWVGKDSSQLLADLDAPGETLLVAKGGRGGAGNARYASSTNQYPMIAQAGEPGVDEEVRLELKLLADVGVIGAPNAGKSSLLAALTSARPRIADYPFTTLEPALGVVEHRNEDFVMVDIPGLIEGAHEGIGLGDDFLRHVERTRVLIHMVDGSLDDPVAQYLQINEELKLFNEDLARKPQILAVNKIDIPEVEEYMSLLEEAFAEAVPDEKVYFVSAAGRQNLDPLMDATIQVLQSAPVRWESEGLSTPTEELPVLRPTPRRTAPKVSVNREGEYTVQLADAIRIAGMVDLDRWEARMQFYRRLQHTGVVKALEDAGVEPGDTVHIGELEFLWE
ncbi:MAG: GTPase ObgE [SAR202 cluster bacterium]|nr:GTPase ObgE [SAR202 cluster bacterium]